jgi:hypothetical protein
MTRRMATDVQGLASRLVGTARDHGLTLFADRVEGLTKQPVTVHVGIVGEFSSGKSSLLNALIGADLLPIGTQPTTATPTLVEARSGTTTPEFRLRTYHGEEVVSPLRFQEAAGGQGEGLPVLVLPPSQSLPEGVCLVDTPGLASVFQAHTDAMLDFARRVDGVALCLDINQGGIGGALLRTLQEPVMQPLLADLVVVLCQADSKSPDAAERIRAEVVSELQRLLPQAACARRPAEDRVVVCSARKARGGDDAAIAPVRDILTSAFLTRRRALEGRRRYATLLDQADDLVELLDREAKNLSLRDAELEAKSRSLEETVQKLKEQRDQARQKVSDFGDKLRHRLTEAALRHRGSVAVPDAAQRTAALESLCADLAEVARGAVQAFDSQLAELPLNVTPGSVQSRIEKIYRMKDLSVTFATAVATAAIAPGATSAKNAAEAGAGAGGRAIAAEAAQVGHVSKFSKVVQFIGKVVRDINPLEHIGDLVAGPLAENAAEDELRTVASALTRHVLAQVTDRVQQAHDAMDAALSNERDALASVHRLRQGHIDEVLRKKKQMEADAGKLRDDVADARVATGQQGDGAA